VDVDSISIQSNVSIMTASLGSFCCAESNLHNNANKLSTKHSCNYLEAELCPRISYAYFSDISLGQLFAFGGSFNVEMS